jgi:small subunit ribosomal protein S4
VSKRKKRKYSISRRINGALWGNKKDPYYKRNYPPGMHGIKGYKRTTEYGYQLIAKQKLKKYYGEIREKQFIRIYKMAEKRTAPAPSAC